MTAKRVMPKTQSAEQDAGLKPRRYIVKCNGNAPAQRGGRYEINSIAFLFVLRFHSSS